MTSAVPIIFTPPVQNPRLSIGGRLWALAIAAGALTVLVIALTISPAPAGSGTHQQLGFQRCQFLATTNLPCLSCGMTTSFAYFVRGNWLASAYVQPMGFILAVMTATVFWAGAYVALRGKPIHRLLRQVPMVSLVVVLAGLGIAAWGWKIFIYVRGIDGWK